MSPWRIVGILLSAATLALATHPLTAQTVEVEFTVGTATTGHTLQNIDVARGGDGNILFIWGNYGSTSVNNSNAAMTRRFSPQGIALGSPVRIDTSGYVLYPNLSADTRGGFVAAWIKSSSGAHRLFGRLLNTSGGTVGNEFQADIVNFGPTVPKAVAGLPGGSVVVWEQNGLWSRTLDATGTPSSPASLAPQYPGSSLDVARTLDGGFVTVWTDPGGTPYGWGRLSGADGQPLAPAFALGSPGDTLVVYHVSVDPSGGLAVLGATAGPDGQGPVKLLVRRFTSDGTPTGELLVHQIDASTYYQGADFAFDPHGELYVVWNESSFSPPFARVFDSSGTAFGPPVLLSTQPGGGVRTASLGNGRFVNAWYLHPNAWGSVVNICADGTCNGAPTPTASPTPIDSGPTATQAQATSTPVPNATATPTVTRCGDGAVQGTEECDDGNQIDGDGCDTNCTRTRCGNGIVSTGEECDDGNTVSGDGCDFQCRIEHCGNGRAEGNEECDDGNQIEGDGCDSNCTLSRCGNHIVANGEECDDGNTLGGDGCDFECHIESCGNGRVDVFEECDDGNLVDGDGCDSNCRVTRCGNGVRTAGEECDDGNQRNSDGCDNQCRIEVCGNGRLEGDEQCDDGNRVDGDPCRANCRIAPVHDSAIASVRPVRVLLRKTRPTVAKRITAHVSNADILPTPERPGHLVQLLASDGTCPPGTVLGADFESGAAGNQDIALVKGGRSAVAHVTIVVSTTAFPNLTRDTPQTCTLIFKARTVLDGNFDPTADNTATVELDVQAF